MICFVTRESLGASFGHLLKIEGVIEGAVFLRKKGSLG